MSRPVVPSILRPWRALRGGGLLALGLVGLALTGCGGTDRGTGARVLVTDRFGEVQVLDRRDVPVEDGDHVLDVLRRATDVRSDRTGDVTQIGDRAATGQRRWRFLINGVPAETGALDDTQPTNEQRPTDRQTASEAPIHDGDTVWFDRADLGDPRRPVATPPRGAVGLFPEPFVHGFEGKRWPLRLECVDPRGDACRQVRDLIVRYGLPASVAPLRSSYNPETARIAVGTWRDLRQDPAAGLLELGPRVSGVFLRPRADGRQVQLLAADGSVARTLGPGTGLVVASRYRDEPPSWIVSGTDADGLARAIAAFDERTLRNRLAIAVSGGDVIALPVRDGR